jgi:hypothetical protein
MSAAKGGSTNLWCWIVHTTKNDSACISTADNRVEQELVEVDKSEISPVAYLKIHTIELEDK